MNKKIKTFLYLLLIIIILIISSFFYGRYLGMEKNKLSEKEITSQIVLDRIKDQYFLVTKTMFYNDKIDIVATQNSGWKDFLWGEEITAYGIVRVDIGVDINKMNLSDIDVDAKQKTIKIILPQAEILDSSLDGDLDISTKKGIFNNIGSLFSSDDGEDYNMAVRELIQNAEYNAASNEEVNKEARNAAAQLIELIMNGLKIDYDIVVE